MQNLEDTIIGFLEIKCTYIFIKGLKTKLCYKKFIPVWLKTEKQGESEQGEGEQRESENVFIATWLD